ncbi:MAG: PAS domain S-box protein [Rhodothermales bacterium]
MNHRAANAERGVPVSSAWKRYFTRIAYTREYLLMAGLFTLVVAGLTLVTYGGAALLASARAYTHAEALYSKSQKDAVYYLHRYATTGQVEYFEKFEQAIAVPLGYRQARAELEKADPNPDVIRQGMIQGRSHPDDAGMSVWGFRLLRRVGPVTRAIRLWSEADLLIAHLQNVADRIHQEMESDAEDPQRVAALLQEVERINVNLTTLEDAFSATLGEAARRVRRLVIAGMLLAAVLLLGLGLVPSWRMLKRLKDSQEQFRRLFEQSRDAIILITLDDRIGTANPAAYELFGYPASAYAQHHLAGVAATSHVVSDVEYQAFFHRLRRDGFVRDYELQLRRTDDTVFDGLVTSMRIRDRHGTVVGFESILRDISERKRTERRMRLLERAVEASGNVILICDATRPDFPIVYVNPAFERITGYPTNEAIGRNGFFLLSAEQDPSEPQRAWLQQALHEGAESRVVVRNYRKDGTLLWNELRFAPVYDAHDELINYVGIQTDITESKEAEEALKNALEKERELSELQARFVSMASHEFRTPLAAILSSAELIERFRHMWDDERVEKHLRRIQTSIHTLTKLLENILVVGKVEAGRLRFEAEEVELVAFCREVIEEVKSGQSADLHIAPDLPTQPLVAQADPNLLRYLLSNLLTNAAKYSPAGSRITFALTQRGGQAVFHVQDEGIGIPQKDLRRVAEPFQRADNAETIPGTGLGLSIVQRAVALHGGTLSIESEEGRGTRVTVSIPLEAKTNASAANT